MPAVNVNVQPDVIRWALGQTKEEKLGEKLMSNIVKWLDGTKTPTFNQIEDFSRKSCIPLGYFFLQTPPKEDIELLKYRTIDSVATENPSRNLIDVIKEMEDVREWMREYRQEMGFDTIPLVGYMRGMEDTDAIARDMRRCLDLDVNWYENCSDSRSSFGYIRENLEKCGVIVMMSGIVGKNTHRALDVDEFRAFAMVDEWAPLIFINATDSGGGKIFSLFHELAHIFLGESDFYNGSHAQEAQKHIEKICNAVAGEMLVPRQEFLKMWDEEAGDEFTVIEDLARHFRCGQVVIARRAMDCNKISEAFYYDVAHKAHEEYKKMRENKEGAGGNYYSTQVSRLDGTFVRALCESIQMGRTSYTEACRLTNTSLKTFPEVAKKLGGAGW